VPSARAERAATPIGEDGRLAMSLGALSHQFRDTEHEYDAATTRDKDMIVIEGATHGFTPCTRCETTPCQYANSVKNFFDYVHDWIAKRY